jgi:hypothetical protein
VMCTKTDESLVYKHRQTRVLIITILCILKIVVFLFLSPVAECSRLFSLLEYFFFHCPSSFCFTLVFSI